MTGLYTDVGSALDAHLESFPYLPVIDGLPMIHFQGTTFEPINGQVWVQTAFLPASPGGRSFGETPITRLQGVYQVAVLGPNGQGPGEVQLMADRLMKHFKSGVRITTQNIKVTLETPRLGNFDDKDPQWIRLPVWVYWNAHTTAL